MSDLHIIAQEILEECKEKISEPIGDIFRKHTEGLNDAEVKLVHDAFQELFLEDILSHNDEDVLE